MNTEYKIDFNKRVFDRIKIPIIDIQIFNRYYSFVLDSGANNCIIDKGFYDKLKEYHEIDTIMDNNQAMSIGLTGPEKVETIKLTLKIATEEVDCHFNVVDMTSFIDYIRKKAGLEIEGLLGCEFFNCLEWMLDFKNLIVWK